MSALRSVTFKIGGNFDCVLVVCVCACVCLETYPGLRPIESQMYDNMSTGNCFIDTSEQGYICELKPLCK